MADTGDGLMGLQPGIKVSALAVHIHVDADQVGDANGNYARGGKLGGPIAKVGQVEAG